MERTSGYHHALCAGARGLGVLGLTLGAGCGSASGPGRGESTAEVRDALTQCVTIQRGGSGDIADALVDQDADTTNYGASTAFRVSKVEESLLRADLSAIPSGASVTSATLALYVYGSTDKNPVNVHAATASWSEATVTWQSFAQQFAPAIAGSFKATGTGYKTVDLTSLTQAWVSGQTPNLGVLLETPPQTRSAAALFASSESDPSTRPSLTVCYQADRCAGVTCAALDACHVAGTCDPGTGVCSNPAAPDGTACNDGNACTQADACQAGTCAGESPVTCAALDACHVPGTCDPGTGLCSNPAAPDGTACTDGNACTQGDACQAGACASGSPVVCVAPDACHTAGTCDPGSGACLGGTSLLTQIPGDYAITSAASLAALACVDQIKGTLTLAGDGTTPVVSLPFLHAIGGWLSVTAGSQIGVVSFPGLATVTGQIDLEHNPALTSVGLGALTSAGLVYVVGNANLQAFDMGALTHTQSVDIVANPALASLGPIGLSSLQTVTQNVTVRQGPLLASLGPQGLGSLVSAGSVDIESMPLLGSLGPGDLAQLASVAGLFEIDACPLITTVDLSHAALGGVYVTGNASLASLRLGGLAAHVSYAVLASNPLLADLGPTGLSPVQSVANDFGVSNTLLTSLGPTGISNLASVGRGMTLFANPNLATLGPTSLAALSAVGTPANGGILDFERNPLITEIDASNAALGGLWVTDNPGLQALRLGNLPAHVTYAVVANDPLLTDLGPTGLSPVQTVAIDFKVSTTALASVGPTGISNLVSVGRGFEMFNNPNLATLGPTSLAALTAVGTPANSGIFDFEKNPLITAIDASNAALGGLWVADNPALASLRLGNLPAHVVYAIINDNPLLTDLGPTGLSPVQTVAVDFKVSTTALASVGPTGISNLVSVGRGFEMFNNPNLATLGPTSLAALTAVGTPANGAIFDFERNPLITAIDASNAALGGLWVASNPGLTSLRLGNLPSHVAYAILDNNPLLADLGPTGLSPIQTITLDLKVSRSALSSLGPTGISNLVTVGRGFEISVNPALASLGPAGLSHLVTVGGGLDLEQNPLLTAADLSALTSIAGYLVVDRNATLAQLLLPSLTHLGGPLQITSNPALPTCFGPLLAQLVGYGGTVNIAGDGPVCP